MDPSHLRAKLSAALLLCLSVTACPADEPVACEPLAATELATELEDIIAIGRTQDGTIVVVDSGRDDNSSARLFLSDGDSLVRQDVAGSGTSNQAGAESWTLSVTETDPPLRVLVQRGGSGLRMKLYQAADALATKSFDFAAAPGEELEILDEEAIASLNVRNLSGDVVVEYFARVGRDRLVVTRPEHDFTNYEGLRLFFGAPAAVKERVISQFMRYRDGGSTRIDFELDGAQASVFFPSRIQPDGPSITEPVTFDVAGAERSIERVLPVDDAELKGLAFQCHAE